MRYIFSLKTLVLIFILCSNSVVSHAQEVWSLKQCLQYAETHNLQYQQAKIAGSLGELNVQSAKNARLPEVSASVTESFNFGRSLDPTTYNFENQNINNTSLGVNVGSLIYSGNRLNELIEQSKLNLRAQLYDNEQLKNDIALSITTAYLAALQAKEQVAIVAQQSEISQAEYERSQKLVKAGVLPEANLIQLEAQLANDALSQTTAENARAQALLTLAQLLDYYEDFDIETPALELPDVASLKARNPKGIYDYAVKNQPQIKAADFREQAAEKDINIARSGKMPSLSWFAGLNSNYVSVAQELVNKDRITAIVPIGYVGSLSGEAVVNSYEIPVSDELRRTPFFNQLSNNFSYNFGLSLRIPIFSQFENKLNVQRAQYNVENTHLQAQQSMRNLRADIETAYLQALAAAKSYDTAAENLRAQKQAFANTQKRYQLGMATIFEFNTARNSQTVAELNLNNARYEYLFRLKILDFYEGKSLGF